jgi:hypothetical protein
VNSEKSNRWLALNDGRWPMQGTGLLLCPQCAAKRPLTRVEADQAVARSMGLFEVYECPSGLGWHLRVVKETQRD